LNFEELIPLLQFTPDGISKLIDRHRVRLSMGGLSCRDQWKKVFDPSVPLDTLPIGILFQQWASLPPQRLPKREAELLRLCRDLIDRGGDDNHIEAMLSGWPSPWTLEAHVRELWKLRQTHPHFFRNVVIGRHGRAMAPFVDGGTQDGLSIVAARGFVTRHGLLWAAFDVQLRIACARVSFSKPLGSFVGTRFLTVVKAGTILRLLRQGLAALADIIGDYQSAQQEAREGPNNAKPKGVVAKQLGHQVRRHYSDDELKQLRPGIDESMAFVRDGYDGLAKQLRSLEDFSTEFVEDHQEAEALQRNRLRHFYPIWYSGLSPAAGMATVLIRYAIAERELAGMVERATTRCPRSNSRGLTLVEPMGPPPSDSAAAAELLERVADLANTARVAQLKDCDWRSRTRAVTKDSISDALKRDPYLGARDPLDMAGMTFVTNAYRFQVVMGQLRAVGEIEAEDPRNFTMEALDLIPERRLAH
jgi:hypothetical protein